MADTPPSAPKSEAVEELAKAPFCEGISYLIITPITLRRIFLLLTRSHFSNSTHYGQWKDKLGHYVWSRDAKASPLSIELDFVYDPKNQDRRPAIFVGTDDVAYRRVVVDDFKGLNQDASGKEYVVIGATKVIIRHVSATADDAYALAELSFQFFQGIRPLMQEKAQFRAYNVMGTMASKPFQRAEQQADMQFVVDLLIQIEFNATWLSVQESHRIKTITYQQSLVELNTLPDKV